MIFPDESRLIHSFPASIKQDVQKVLSTLSSYQNFHLSDNSITVSLQCEIIQFPYRVYIEEPDSIKENELNKLLKAILNCILSRHNNGFVRQRRLEQLTHATDLFIVPFVIQLSSEYVQHILIAVHQIIKESWLQDYQDFIKENRDYWRKTESRIVSYWNEYYRFPNGKNFNDYIGKKILDKLQTSKK